MKLEVGMYVRTKWGINKINEYVPRSGQLYLKNDVCVKSNVIKASHNIIDLIEVGDYVNGFRVISLWKDKGKVIGVAVDGGVIGFDECEIKSIVTKEQFKSMDYRVEK